MEAEKLIWKIKHNVYSVGDLIYEINKSVGKEKSQYIFRNNIVKYLMKAEENGLITIISSDGYNTCNFNIHIPFEDLLKEATNYFICSLDCNIDKKTDIVDKTYTTTYFADHSEILDLQQNKTRDTHIGYVRACLKELDSKGKVKINRTNKIGSKVNISLNSPEAEIIKYIKENYDSSTISTLCKKKIDSDKTPSHKFCPICKETKESSKFYKLLHGKDGLSPYCKECAKAKQREYNLQKKSTRSEPNKQPITPGKKAWATRVANGNAPNKKYDAPKKNEFRQKVVESFGSKGNVLALESSELLFVNAIPNHSVTVIEEDLDTYKSIAKANKPNVTVYYGDISFANEIEGFNFDCAFLDFCRTLDTSENSIISLMEKLNKCKTIALTFSLRGHKKEIEDYRYDIAFKIAKLFPNFKPIHAETYKDTSPMVGIILENNSIIKLKEKK